MTMHIEAFRKQVISAILAVKNAQPQTQLYLLYTPELADPLSLIGNTQRETIFINPPSGNDVIFPKKERRPRIITLDCRRVASYLLETDPALDDPLFESSITQAHAEVQLGQKQDTESTNAEREYSDVSIGGWILSAEPASTIATQMQRYTQKLHATKERQLVRWTNPIYMSALWPSMSAEQKQALLGSAIWLGFSTLGQLQRYAVAASTEGHSSEMPNSQLGLLNQQQQVILKNIPLVRDLLGAWQTICQETATHLPADAEQQLHAYVKEAQQTGLNAESVAFYAMTVIQLKPEARQDPAWQTLIKHTAEQGLLLRDEIHQLPDVFFEQYSEHEIPA